MERRVVVAILLMTIVAIAPYFIWPAKRTARRPAAGTDSVVDRTPTPTAPAAPAATPARPLLDRAPVPVPAETVWVSAPLYRVGLSTRGATVAAVELTNYRSFAPGDSGPLQLVPPGRPFLAHRLVAGADTLALGAWDFEPSRPEVHVTGDPVEVEFRAARGGGHVTLTYRFEPDQYVFGVRGEVSGATGGGLVLLVDLGDGLRSVEADSAADYREFAVVTKAEQTERRRFASLDPGEADTLRGPFEWVGFKSKYFLLAALTIEAGQPQFGGAFVRGGPKPGKFHTRNAVTLTLPVSTATFRYQVYAGPLEYRRLSAIGHQLDDANPYGWIFRPIIQPVSVGVVYVLLWMHERLNLAYGWVLILFGLAVRLLLWPLNQRAMESGIRMQAVAPLIKEIQDRHRNDPERLQRELMRVYREHKVNPLGGCLPMLIPMPVLFALFFVFANTIEFRGVPFLWIPDLARSDPLYIIPLLMGLSMYAVSKIGQMGVPPNPQTKMMLYFLPVMMTVLFFNFASGLNLYYAAQNVFSLPQQYLIARRRMREAPVAKR